MKRLKFVRYDNRKHFDSMFLYMSDVEEQRMFLTYTSANSVREFENWLENQLRSYYKEFFVIEDNNELIGFVYSYEHCSAMACRWNWSGCRSADDALYFLPLSYA